MNPFTYINPLDVNPTNVSPSVSLSITPIEKEEFNFIFPVTNSGDFEDKKANDSLS